MNDIQHVWRGFLAAVLVGLAGWGTGCSSTDNGAPSGFAAVTIEGNTPGQIGQAAKEVFEEAGYTVAQPGLTRLVFEKRGSKMDQIAYGNWMGETGVWVRVKAAIVPVREGVFRLQCEGFTLRDRGGTMEEEIRVRRKGTWQEMLDEVARRLKPSGL